MATESDDKKSETDLKEKEDTVISFREGFNKMRSINWRPNNPERKIFLFDTIDQMIQIFSQLKQTKN